MSSPSPRRVILVGCGALARHLYVPALRALQDAGLVRVSGIVDPSVNAREAVARTFPRAGQTAALEQTTAPANSLVILASPTGLHAMQAIFAVEKGWHVLCENPAAGTPAEAAEMIAAARRHQRVLAVNLHKRFFPSARYLRTLCRDWLLGPLVSFNINEGGIARSSGAANFDRTQDASGVLFELGPGVLDLLGWWLGEPAAVRYADDAMGGLEANAFIQLDYASGARGRVHLSRDWIAADEYRFEFERGVVTWRGRDPAGLNLQLAGAPAAVEGGLVAPRLDPWPVGEVRPLESAAQGFVLQLQNVLSAIAGETELLVDAEEAQSSLRLIERCHAHRSLVEQPWLTPEEAGRAHELSSALPAAT